MGKVQNEMATRITVDSVGAIKSYKALTDAVKASTNAWKASEVQLKSSGNYQEAAKTKVEGLTKSIDLQKGKLAELKARQQDINKSTKEGQESYFKLENQIASATRQLGNYEGQLSRAKSSSAYYTSGLADLQKGYKQTIALSESYVKRLEAEGKSAEANKAKLGGLKQAYSNMEAQYKAQTSELERIKTASGATSDAYKRQQVRVNETATSMAKLKSETNDLDSAMKKANASAFTKMLDSAKSKLGLVRDEEKKTKDETKHFAIGAAIGNAISSAASSAMGYIKGVTEQGYKLAEAGATIKKQWTNLGLSNADATKMTKQISDIRSKANMSGGAIDQMQKKFYAMTNSATKARAMTEVIASYGSAAGKSSDQIASMSQEMARLAGSSKVTSILFKRTFGQVPELQKAIIKASGMSTDAFNKQLAAGKITGSQLQGYMVKAAKTSGKAWSEFGDTTKGKMAAIQGTYTNLKAAFAKPLVSGVEKAIDGVSKKKGALDGVKKSLTDLVGTLGKKTGQYVGDVISFLVKNEKPIEKTGGAIANIVGSLAKGAWSAVAGSLKLIGGHSKDASKGMNGVASATAAIAKHQTAIQNVGKAIMVYLAVSKLKGIASTISSVAGGIGKVIGGMGKAIGIMARLAKSEKIAAAAQWLLNAAMHANPIGIAVIAIAALTAGLVLAYKHIKPFREWVNKTAKAVVNFGKGLLRWGSKAVKTVGNTVDNIRKKFDKFKSDFKKSWNEHWSAIGNSLRNAWNGAVKHTREFFRNIAKGFSSFGKSFKRAWNNTWNSVNKFFYNIFDGIHKIFKSWTTAISRAWNGFKSWFREKWKSLWNGIHDFFRNITRGLSRTFHGWIKGTMDAFGGFGNSFKSGWNGLVKGVKDIFSGLWKDLKGFARDGMNDVIDLINGGINAIDSVIHTFGGKKKTIGDLSHVHFAEGTGMFSGQRNPITKPTMAMLNDGNDSPQTGNKEMVMLPNGDSGIVQGRNTKMMLPAGSEVLSASETAMVMAMQGVTKYAKGTGFFGDILNSVTSGISGVTNWVGKKVDSLEKFFKTAENIIAHPIKSLENLFSWSSKGISGVMSNIGHGLFNGVEKQVKTWWSTLWGGVSDSLDSGASSSKLVNAMEKYGATNKYVYGAEGPSAFDCSGLVEYTLKKLGISFPRTSGEQYKASKHVSDPKPGDLVFFGPGGSDHVGVYTGNGEFYSAENEHDGMGISKVHGGGYGSFAGYGRVPGLSDSTSSDKSSKSSGLLGTIKKQVGSGFWKFISKLADMFGDGGSSNPGGSGVQRWKPDVIKALKKNGFEASASQVSAWMKVIARESNGDPTVVNNWDANARMGIPSKGLVQTIQPTFDAYKFPGHNNPLNGYDDLLAGIHYMKAKYGSGPSAFARVSGPEGYENGGIINTNQLIEVAEHNKPEMVLPLTNKSRANQLIAQASQVVNGNNGSQIATQSSESNEKLDKVISLLAALLAGQGNVQAVISNDSIVNANKNYTKKVSQYSQMMGY